MQPKPREGSSGSIPTSPKSACVFWKQQKGSLMTDSIVISTAPQRERKAADNLGVAGIKIKRFLEHVRVRRGEKPKSFKLIARDLAPGYVYGDASKDDVARAIANEHQSGRWAARGIVGLTSQASLAPLAAIDGREVCEQSEATAKPRIGDLVTVRSGPFQGWNVKVRALHGSAFSADCKGYPIRLPYDHLRHPE